MLNVMLKGNSDIALQRGRGIMDSGIIYWILDCEAAIDLSFLISDFLDFGLWIDLEHFRLNLQAVRTSIK